MKVGFFVNNISGMPQSGRGGSLVKKNYLYIVIHNLKL